MQWLVAVLAALSVSFVAHAQMIQDGVPFDPNNPEHQIWQPAPTVDGSVPWETLGATGENEVELEDGLWILPEFTPEVLALKDQVIRVNGFMLPLQTSDKQTHFLLMAYPPDCPFCLSAGPAWLIEIKTEEPIAFSYEPFLIEGTLTLLEKDESGLFYRISDARVIER